MSNRLEYETSPYLLQHKDNPVDWYPWCREAFIKAESEDKPIFLSIGYSTCHWCHVMAHESFEDELIAAVLNENFVCIKVDKEERPDIDSIYMTVCQAFTGSGGWPMSIFMTHEQQPFFAGTYFPKQSQNGMIGFRELLLAIHDKWSTDRETLLQQAQTIVHDLQEQSFSEETADNIDLLSSAVSLYKRIYDSRYGGFGKAPKFPAPHNLLFLLSYYQRFADEGCLKMAENTLIQMYRGGLFDHIGGGFCRYSTDSRFLVPHFEKMLYDNALLILAYCKAYSLTGKPLYKDIAELTVNYILREMTAPQGGFYSAQDADSNGVEGKYYLFTPNELRQLLGENIGIAFCQHFGITDEGNFEGSSIPNLLESEPSSRAFDAILPRIRQYRKDRYPLHLDDKILTAWNGLMISAMCELYRISSNRIYLTAAKKADSFIKKHLQDNDALFVSYRQGKHGIGGFLDDYTAYIFSQLSLYGVTLEQEYLLTAERLCQKVISDFCDSSGGYYLYGSDGEKLIFRPKETYDGAVPSGNSLMAYILLRLYFITGKETYHKEFEKQFAFLSSHAAQYPIGHSMFLYTLTEYHKPPMKVTAVWDGVSDISMIPLSLPGDTALILLPRPTSEYPLINGKTTFYVCMENRCLPPINDLSEII